MNALRSRFLSASAAIGLAALPLPARADLVVNFGEQVRLGATEYAHRVANNGVIIASVDPEVPLTFTGLVHGAGAYVGDVVFAGAYRPGNSPAAVDFAGDLALGGTNLLTMEIGGLTPDSQHDQLNVLGTLTLNGTLTIELIDVGAGVFSPELGDAFDLFNWGTLGGTFQTLVLPDLGPDVRWDTSQLYATGVLTVAAVPEASALLFLSVAVGCWFAGVVARRCVWLKFVCAAHRPSAAK